MMNSLENHHCLLKLAVFSPLCAKLVLSPEPLKQQCLGTAQDSFTNMWLKFVVFIQKVAFYVLIIKFLSNLQIEICLLATWGAGTSKKDASRFGTLMKAVSPRSILNLAWQKTEGHAS